MSFGTAAGLNRPTRHGVSACAFGMLLPVLALFAAVLASMPAQAELRARLQAEELSRYARLIISFDRLPKYKARMNTGVFVLEFGEPVNIEVSKLTENLQDYVAAARLDPDGGAMRLALTQIVTINTMEAGEQLFIDFLPKGWTGLPPGLPEEVIARLAQRAKEAEEEAKLQALRDAGLADVPQVSLDIGQNPTFTRLEFGWDRTVDAKVTRDGKTVTVQFNTPGKVDLAELHAAMPRFVSGGESDLTRDGMVVTFQVDRTAGVRAFADGKTYTVDITGSADALQGDANLRAVSPVVDTGLQSGATLATEIAGQSEPQRATPEQASVRPDAPELQLTSQAFDPGAYEPSDYGDWQTGRDMGQVAQGQAGAVPGPTNTSAMPEQRPPGSGPAMQGSASQNASASASAGTPASISVRATRIGQSVRLNFAFPEPVASAVFNRGNAVWIVFDSSIPLDLGNIERELNDRASEIKLTNAGDMQYLRVVMSKPELTTAAAEANLWSVTIGDMILEPSKPLALRRTLDNDGHSLIAVDLPSAGRVHWLRDPELKDDIAVVTAMGPPRGLFKPQEFVELTAFPSAHGFALQPLADDLRVSLRIDEVAVSRNGGLWLSAGGAQQYAPGRRETGDVRQPGFVDFAGITHARRAKFIASRQQLETQAAMLEGEAHLPAQMTLARFYVGHQLAAEALGLLESIKQKEVGIEGDPNFNALRGIANLLIGREEQARKDLFVHGLSQSRDIKLWRGMLELNARNWRAAQLAVQEGEAAITAYPTDMQARFRLTGARAAIEVKDLADAAHHLDNMPPTEDRDLAAQGILLRARLQEGLGRVDEAFAAYQAAKETTVRPVVAEATVRELELRRRMGTIQPDEALDQLETLAVAWRGDDIELETLKMLAEISASKGDYRRAFEAMRTASLVQPDAEITRYIQDQMAHVFQDLFLNGASEKLSAIDALALYYDFRDLTPVGRLGDDMIRRLADRLVEVDLLDQASELLAYQIDNRLRGAARAQVAGRLATILLMAHQPAKAISVLQRTRVAGLPGELQRQRSMLEARALSETGRIELALELLDSMQGDDVDRLRADTLWKGQNWQELAEHVERMLGDTWSDQTLSPLSSAQRYDVMRAAIGYSMARDQIGLDRLHTKYAKKMAESADAHAFEVVTAPIAGQGEEFLSLARQIASVDTLEAFLVEMQKNYGSADDAQGAPPPS